MTENDHMPDDKDFPPTPGPDGADDEESVDEAPETPLPPPAGRTRGEPPETGARPKDAGEDEGSDQQEPQMEMDEQRRRQYAEIIAGDTEAGEQQIANALSILGVPEEAAPAYLAARGHDPEKIRQVMELAKDLPDAPTDEEGEIPEEEEASTARKAIEEQMAEIKAIEEKVRSGHADEHDAHAVLKKQNWLSKFLFDEETGVWRKGNRKKATGKALGTGGFALLIAYLLFLGSMTKWATKRVGSG